MPRSGRRLTAAFGAALAALALPRAGFWFFGWVGLVPLVLAANEAEDPKEAAKLGFAAGFAYHAVVLHWVYQTCRFAQVPAPVSLFAWAALAAFLALNWGAAAALSRAHAWPRWARPFSWALSYAAVAAATGHWTPRLAVDSLGYTQWPNLGLLQALSWGGPHLLDLVVMLVNAALAEAYVCAQSPGTDGEGKTRLSVAACLGAAALVWLHGAWTLARRPADPGPTAKVAILQPAVDQYAKWDEKRLSETTENFRELVHRPGAPALVVWPETALPRWQERREAAAEAAAWAKESGATHLVGVVAADDGGGPANGVQLVRPDGSVGGFYMKRELVPFGEYVPLRSWVPRFVVDNWLAVLDQLGDMAAGAPDQRLIVTPFGPTAVTLCYEAMFPRWANRDAARGARLLVNVTNDGWYKDTWGPYQHYRANVFRAIENRIETLRSGNTGISAAIDPWGVVTAELPLNVRGRLDADVPVEDPFPRRSFYARWGDWAGAWSMALALLPFVL